MASETDQKQAFLDGEGDAYFRRNRHRETGEEADPVVRVIRGLRLGRGRILEIGCGTGQRLATLHADTGADCAGIDPSHEAIEAARTLSPGFDLKVGTADDLPFPTASFDVVIFGFCLYLVDQADLFAVATQTDRVLKDGGAVLIYDFSTPTPYHNIYAHRAGLVARKMDWSRMFTWNPAYTMIHREFAASAEAALRDVDGRLAVDVLVKDTAAAFPPKR